MLSLEIFKKVYLGANQMKGVNVSETEMNIAYACVKDHFNDKEFSDIAINIIQNVNTYGKIIDIREWFERRNFKTEHKTEVQKTYDYFISKNTPSSFASLLARINENPNDAFAVKLLTEKPMLKDLVDMYRHDENINKIFSYYNTPLLDAEPKQQELEFKPTFVKKIGE